MNSNCNRIKIIIKANDTAKIVSLRLRWVVELKIYICRLIVIVIKLELSLRQIAVESLFKRLAIQSTTIQLERCYRTTTSCIEVRGISFSVPFGFWACGMFSKQLKKKPLTFFLFQNCFRLHRIFFGITDRTRIGFIA